MYQYILFDLDGTLTDPKEGITKCVQYAVNKKGLGEPDLDTLTPFIGPPLVDSFMRFFPMTEEDAKQAVVYYRERFSTIGKFENKVYDGIPELLSHLKGKGARLAVASSKPTVYVNDILKHFDLYDYFDVIVGSELDGRRIAKEEVVAEALSLLHEGKELTDEIRRQTAMVGDRKFDIQGARAYGLTGVLVTYGYAEPGEKEEAAPDFAVDTVKELEACLTVNPKETFGSVPEPEAIPTSETIPDKEAVSASEEIPDKEVKSTLTQEFRNTQKRSLLGTLFLPLVIYLLVSSITVYISEALMKYVAVGTMGSRFASWVFRNPAEVSAVSQALGYVFSFLAVWKFYKITCDMFLKWQNKSPRIWDFLRMAVPVVCIGLLLNLLVSKFEIASYFPQYKAALESQSTIGLTVGLLLFGIAAPIGEEIVFRGIAYNRLSMAFGEKAGVILSSLLFAVLHVYPIEILYAFIMGCLIALCYKRYHKLWVPTLVHAITNILVFGLLKVLG